MSEYVIFWNLSIILSVRWIEADLNKTAKNYTPN